ncbi:hypothetical protein ACH50O_05240 [Methylomonas sp. 2BW1-5-20]|uniref:hypothetical protein n=1 Tax=Methylomonas sp. 2BW1-5-20 TaxID=3376686 RepID=UPI00404D8B9E
MFDAIHGGRFLPCHDADFRPGKPWELFLFSLAVRDLGGGKTSDAFCDVFLCYSWIIP